MSIDRASLKPPTLQDVYAARAVIMGTATRTPLLRSFAFSDETRDVRLKLETAQPTGSFKIRGAANAVALLGPGEAKAGVVCASTGNHGRALSYAAAKAGIRATVCMSVLVPRNKVEAIRSLGADVVIAGRSQDDAQAAADDLVATRGMTPVPPFDHPAIVTGQATIVIELMEDFPQVDTILVPLSGGGLIGGVAVAAKSINPGIRVIGIGTAQCPAMVASLVAGRPVDVVEHESVADSLGGGIGLGNRLTFSLAQRFVDETMSASEDQIIRAMRGLFAREALVCEGAGAVGLIPLLEPCPVSVGRRVAVILTGRNVDMGRFQEICVPT